MQTEENVKIKKKKKTKVNKTVLDFVESFNIKIGTNKVRNSVIFYEYIVSWRNPRHSGKLGKSAFFRAFSQLFPRYRKNHCRGYLLEGEFDLSKDFLFKARVYEREYNLKVKGKSKNVRQKEKS